MATDRERRRKALDFAKRCVETAQTRELDSSVFITGLAMALYLLKGEEDRNLAKFFEAHAALCESKGAIAS